MLFASFSIENEENHTIRFDTHVWIPRRKLPLLSLEKKTTAKHNHRVYCRDTQSEPREMGLKDRIRN